MKFAKMEVAYAEGRRSKRGYVSDDGVHEIVVYRLQKCERKMVRLLSWLKS